MRFPGHLRVDSDHSLPSLVDWQQSNCEICEGEPPSPCVVSGKEARGSDVVVSGSKLCRQLWFVSLHQTAWSLLPPSPSNHGR
ncbi:hypothetical protein OPV22_003690 [Ensete ventricosum]|uniref:Uncharacterized protein n=1 Tax=Ensete ventricosum TaxID=4639 RepID=A0AAV8S1F9_ENSVE|nr:hypothetical protein OPV22_003690 [Ensete ventricosum]